MSCGALPPYALSSTTCSSATPLSSTVPLIGIGYRIFVARARLSVLIHDADRPLHWVGITGSADLLREGEAAVDGAMAMARRYGEDPAAYQDQHRVSFRIVPGRVYQYG
jgi:hypothetical protein